HKDVSQRTVEDWRQEVAHLHSWLQPEMFDLPVDEVIDSFEPARDCLRHARAAAREIDVAQLIGLRWYLGIGVGLVQVIFKADETRACGLAQLGGELEMSAVGDDQGWL